jgi:phage gp46-like protein
MLRIIPLGDADEVYRIPDIALDSYGVGDLALTSFLTGDNPGDFACGQGLRTQVIICLLTDARVEASELRDGDENRGWIGDTYDLVGNEKPIGSKLWLLRRSSLYDGIELDAARYAREALQTLIDQGAAARAETSAVVDRARNRLELSVALYGRDGSRTYQEKFALLWRQIDGLDAANAR